MLTGDSTVVPRSPPSACLGGGSHESGKGGNGVNNDGNLTFHNKDCDGDPVGNSEVRSAPSEGIKSNREEVEVASISGDAFVNDGGDCVMKVASSSAAGGSFIKEGSDSVMKVVPSSAAGGVNDALHAKVKCRKRYRIMVKGAACCGQTCCGGTT